LNIITAQGGALQVDGVAQTVSETELDSLSGVTAGTVLASKALIVDASKNLATLGTIAMTGLTCTTIAASSNVTIAGTLTVGTDAEGKDVIFYTDITEYKVWLDVNGDTNGCWYFGADQYGIMTYWYGDTTGYYTKFDPSGDANGAWYFGADTKGLMVNLYGDVTGCGVFWNPSTDTNGTLSVGASGGSKGNDFVAYGATNGNYLHWDQSGDDLLLVGTATQFAIAGTTDSSSTTTGSLRTAGGAAVAKNLYVGVNASIAGTLTLGSDAEGKDVIFYTDVTGYKVWLDVDGDTNGTWYFGADTKGIMTYWYGDTTGYYTKFDPSGDANGAWYFGADTKGLMVNLYGDTTGCGVFWNPSTDTNGTLSIGASGGSKGNDVVIYGATNGAYMQWDQSANKLIMTNSRLDFANTTQAIEVACSAIGATGRIAKFAGTITHGALTDGYGAVEVDLTLAGTNTDHIAAFSTWANVTTGVATAGTYICAMNNGIYEVAGATITNAKMIFGQRMHYLAEDSDGLAFPFSVNTNNTVITALIDCVNKEDLGWVDGVLSSATGDGHIPLFRDTAGTVHYVNTYTA
jgi:hypothetical protein